MRKRRGNLSRDENESIYQFRFGQRRMRTILTGTLVVFGLIFLLGFLIGKSLIPETDWVAKVTREAKGRFLKPAGIRFTSAEALETIKTTKRKRLKKLKKAVQGSGMVKRMIPRENPLPAKAAGKSPEKGRVKPRPPVRAKKAEPPKRAATLRPALSPPLPRPVGGLGLVRPSVARPESLKTKLSSFLLRVGPGSEAEASAPQSGPLPRKRAAPSRARHSADAARARPPAPVKTMSPLLEAERISTPRNLFRIRKAGMPSTIKTSPLPPSGGKRSGLRPATPGKVPDAPPAPRPVRVTYSGKGRYYILVGSHADRRDALEQREALRRNAYPAFIRMSDLGAKGKRHQVIVGRYRDLDRATEEAGRLGRMENVRPRVFKEGETGAP